jgi:CHAD domain-containing protein
MRIRHIQLSPVSGRNVLLRQIRGASRTLKQKPLTDESIHQTRKKLKRARATLRILRDAVGQSVYAHENTELRNAARPLGSVRDARVALDALENLSAHEKKGLQHASVLKLRRALRESRRNQHRELQRTENREASARAIDAAGRRIEKWRIQSDGAAALLAGIARVYRKGRKALGRMQSDCSDQNLHESRKQAKYIGQALEIFKPLSVHYLAQWIKRAESMAERLGEDHDLVILQNRITNLSGGRHATYTGLLASIERRRRKLQGKALKQGRHLYQSKAKNFIEHVKTLA